MAKSLEEMGKAVDALDRQIDVARGYAEGLPRLEEQKAQIVSQMQRRLGGLSEDPAEDEDAPSLPQEKDDQVGQGKEAGCAQTQGDAEEIETVDDEGLVPMKVAEDLGLKELRQETDGSVRFGKTFTL